MEVKNYKELPLEVGKVYKTKFQTQELFELKEIIYKPNDVENKIIGLKGVYINKPHLGICPLGADRLQPERVKVKLDELGTNCVLYTKDGRVVGNAIVLGQYEKGWFVETDYGSFMTLNTKEIKEMFHIGNNHLSEEERELCKIYITSHKNYSPIGEDLILIEKGEVFRGNREIFRDCFFDNASDEGIKEWCEFNKFELIILKN